MSKLKRVVYGIAPIVLLVVVFFYDVVRTTVNLEDRGFSLIREVAVIGSVLLAYLFIVEGRRARTRAAAREIGRLLIVMVSTIALVGLIQVIPGMRFTEGDVLSVPQNSPTALLSIVAGIAVAVASIMTMLVVKELVYHKRKKGTKRNFVIYAAVLTVSSFLAFPPLAEEAGLLTTALFVLAVVMIVVNAFRQNWIVFLSRREKMYALVYSALLFATFLVMSLLLTNRTLLNKSVSFFSSPVEQFVMLNSIFGAVYFGMAFVSTLFHLPTAEVYERKRSELSSLHNLSRLVTQVFDFRDLVNTVTQMTREVCGAQSSWLELVRTVEKGQPGIVDVVALNNIDAKTIEQMTGNHEFSIRDLIFESKKVLLVDEVSVDRRTRHMKTLGLPVGSLLSVPLVSHNELIGILHATKEMEFGFDQDDIDVVTTFADHVTIAIENSRLIEQSLERERFRQEMMVAQQMQKRLLPQRFPENKAFDVAAMSEPSMEVGGDYFDFVSLDQDRLGVVVGDVSGKGVSAAFYMAEVKGIFQSLSKMCSSPRELLIKANQTLMESLERKAFISLLYAVFDIRRGTLSLARAGHCPMIHVSGKRKELVRPNGLGLGLTNGEIFETATEEKIMTLKGGDICLFYTDGVTEARNEDGEEFGYDRLVEVVTAMQAEPAQKIQDRILSEIRAYCGQVSFDDDMTLVVVKWHGS